ncbi:hypothetical protein CLOM_g4397 [Closterium sp. NIES-68]|nr:hypothetical protein CLOM_g4397 [Closterium sp. NIES-68]
MIQAGDYPVPSPSRDPIHRASARMSEALSVRSDASSRRTNLEASASSAWHRNGHFNYNLSVNRRCFPGSDQRAIESKKESQRKAAYPCRLDVLVFTYALICTAFSQPLAAAAAIPAGNTAAADVAAAQVAAAAEAADAEGAAMAASFGWHGDPLAHLDGSEGAAFVAPCLPSGLAGFSHSVILSESGLILHWVRRNLLFMEFALEARFGSGAENGWIAVGWSHDGRMVPSLAIVGSPAGIAAPSRAPGGRGTGPGGMAGVAAYAISGYRREDARQLVGGEGSGREGEESGEEGWSIYTSARGSTVMRFSRSLLSNPPVLNTSASVISTKYDQHPSSEPTYSMSHHVIWAHSDRQEDALRYHGRSRGSIFVDYMCELLASPARLACQPSSLPGYSCMLQLQGDSFTLHWHLTPSSLLLAADVATSGWVAVGWSKDGKMAGSEAAIGNLPRGSSSMKTGGGADVSGKEEQQAVGSFLIGGYERSAIRSTLKFTVTNASVTTTTKGRTVMKFERPIVNGELPLSSADVATIIWAYSDADSRKLTFHGNNRGSVAINLITGESITASPSPSASSSSSSSPPFSKPAIIAHAILLIAAFLVLLPSAILVARICLVNLPGNDGNYHTTTTTTTSSSSSSQHQRQQQWLWQSHIGWIHAHWATSAC